MYDKERREAEEWLSSMSTYLQQQGIVPIQMPIKIEEVESFNPLIKTTIFPKPAMPLWKKIAIGTGLVGLVGAASILYSKYQQYWQPKPIIQK